MQDLVASSGKIEQPTEQPSLSNILDSLRWPSVAIKTLKHHSGLLYKHGGTTRQSLQKRTRSLYRYEVRIRQTQFLITGNTGTKTLIDTICHFCGDPTHGTFRACHFRWNVRFCQIKLPRDQGQHGWMNFIPRHGAKYFPGPFFFYLVKFHAL